MRQGADMRKAILLLVVVVMAVSSVAYAEVLREYYPNGQLKEETNWKDGEREGPYKEYYESGELREEVSAKDGKPEGIYKRYYKTGQERKKEATKTANRKAYARGTTKVVI